MEIYQDREKRLYNIKFCVNLVIVSLLILLGVIIFFSDNYLVIAFLGIFIVKGLLAFRFQFNMLDFKEPIISLTPMGIYNYTSAVNKGFHAWSDIDSAVYVRKGFAKTIELVKSEKLVTTIYFDSITIDPQLLLDEIRLRRFKYSVG